MTIYLPLLTICYILCVIISGYGRRKQQEFLICLLLLTTLAITFRDPMTWSDTQGYLNSFQYHTKDLFTFTLHDPMASYSERGFYLIGVVVKTFTENQRCYLLVVAALSMYLLYKDLRRYAVYPLIVLCLYLARFGFGRHFVQMRAGLAITIVVWGLRYITRRQPWRYLAVIICASLIHTSALIVLPTYLLNGIPLKKGHVVIILLGALLFAATCRTSIRTNVSLWAVETEMASSYTSERQTVKSQGQGLYNPMILYQSALLLLLTFHERKLRETTPHYITFRNGYLYSTVWLIVLSSFQILAGRGSTITATYECFFLPLFIHLFRGRDRLIPYIALYLYIIIWLTINIHK